MDEERTVAEEIQCTPWTEIPKSLLEWRAGSGSRPKKRTLPSEFTNGCGVYLLAECPAGTDYSGQPVALTTDPIIYVGKAGLQTFFERWTNTHAAWEKLGERYKAANRAMRFFCSVATVRRKEIRLRVWSEEMRITADAVYIEALEQATRNVLKGHNAYFRDHNLDGGK
jgi:hypothetical protein